MQKYSIKDLTLNQKKVFLRLDLNLPLDKNYVISDTTRLEKALPTIRYLLKNKAKVAIFSHLGRPKSNQDGNLSLKPVAAILEKYLNEKVVFVSKIEPNEINDLLDKPSNKVLLLENTRFYPQEKNNEQKFCHDLAAIFDIYVNDSFGTAHRKEATSYGIAKLFKEPACGFLMKEELTNLSNLITEPKRPFVAILGGAKIKDKIPILKKLVNIADAILIGGGMSYTFLKSQGIKIGNSLLDEDNLLFAKKCLQKYPKKIFLPSDHIATSNLENNANILQCQEIPNGKLGVDLGEQTLDIYCKIINTAQTIFWNGPLGVVEIEPFDKGTKVVAQAVAKNSGFSVIGGGDSISIINKLNLADKISHISTGGGAALKFIAGENLPAIEVLKDK